MGSWYSIHCTGSDATFWIVRVLPEPERCMVTTRALGTADNCVVASLNVGLHGLQMRKKNTVLHVACAPTH